LDKIISPIDEKNQLSSDMLLFIGKTARSVSEIQEGVNNVADVVSFLELLGISERVAKEKGFSSLLELSRYVYNFVEFYDENKYSNVSRTQLVSKIQNQTDSNIHDDEKIKSSNSFVKLPSLGEKLTEALSFYSPWLTAIILLNITGSSLWMVTTLPAGFNTFFISGVFLGIVLTEGIMQMFGRILSSSFSQKNLSEFKRTLFRTYVLTGVILAAASGIIALVGLAANFPASLTMILVGAAASISLHRASFLIMYALKKFKSLLASYAGGFISLLSIYYLIPLEMIPDVTTRYFLALGTAFGVLSSFSLYYHYKILKGIGPSLLSEENPPNFYNPPAEIKNTIKSKFKVQFWESLPYFIFGTFYFVLIFVDRVLSWIFNDFLYIASNGTALPLVFNSNYHAGADWALIILIPTIIIQHVVMAPIHHTASNKLATLKISETDKLGIFLKRKYFELIIISLIASSIPAILLNVFGEELMNLAQGSETSLRIMQYASIANVLLSIFMANSLFINFLNKAKISALIVCIGASVVIVCGWILGEQGFENIIYAYLLGAAIALIVSTLFVIKYIQNSAMRFLGRYS
jgi:O-antigen/teichoic acid export membrane protein